MARNAIPNPLERRHLVEKELPAAQALAIAQAYLEQDRCVEAVDFLRIAKADDRLAELRARAIADGDAFLLRTVAGAQQNPATREEWQRVATAATGRGLDRYALEARRQAERGDD
jgi:hypothetical protein